MITTLTTLTGNGDFFDPFRPAGADSFGSWTMLDLREDPSKLDGECLLTVPDELASRLSAAALTKEEAIARALEHYPFTEILLGGEVVYKVPVKPSEEELVDPSDNFTRANENPLGGNWTKNYGNNLQILSNQLTSAAGSDNHTEYIWNAANPGTNNHYGEVTIASVGHNSNAGVGATCRSTLVGDNAYLASAYQPGGRSVWKITGGAFAMFGSDVTSVTFVNGDVVRLECNGTTIRGLRNGTQYAVATDGTFPSGGWGIWFFTYDATMSLWNAGDIGAAPTASPWQTYSMMMEA